MSESSGAGGALTSDATSATLARMQTGRLDGLSIVIVGGTAGIGLAAAQACRHEGASLTIVGKPDEHADRAADVLGADVRVMRGDATHPATAVEAIANAVAAYGRVDGVFHVAGGSGRRWGDGPLDAITDEGWQQTIDLNLSSLFYTNRAAAQHFLGAGHGGAVLNMASVLAFSPSPAHFATHTYAAAKAGAIGLTRSCAAYYARHDIRFNVIAPALVHTPGAVRAAADARVAAYVRHKQPLDGGRIAHPDDITGAVVYLLSHEARFVTGQVLAVDGGWCVSDAAALLEPPAEQA
jgi:NAD(P)-dependent dehydrogenase (short-subunit alcohol dehydrogenase family)